MLVFIVTAGGITYVSQRVGRQIRRAYGGLERGAREVPMESAA